MCVRFSPLHRWRSITEVFSTLRRDNQTLLLVVITGMALAVATQGKQYSTIRETPLRYCQNQEFRILALSPTVASVTKTGS